MAEGEHCLLGMSQDSAAHFAVPYLKPRRYRPFEQGLEVGCYQLPLKNDCWPMVHILLGLQCPLTWVRLVSGIDGLRTAWHVFSNVRRNFLSAHWAAKQGPSCHSRPSQLVADVYRHSDCSLMPPKAACRFSWQLCRLHSMSAD